LPIVWFRSAADKRAWHKRKVNGSVRGKLFGILRRGNFQPASTVATAGEQRKVDYMGRALLLWLIGIPIPIILLIWLLGGLHG
jgi:hypothetical protein